MATRTKEPNQGLRRHKLMPADLRKALPALRSTDGQGMGAVAHGKFFSSFGRYTFYITEFDGEDTLYGYCVSALGPDGDEWSYASLNELAQATLFGGVPAIERDCYFTPATVGEFVDGE